MQAVATISNPIRVKTPWIYSPKFDLSAIIGPPVAITLFVLIWGSRLASLDMPIWVWVVLILGIDVAHVYSSLFRTYFDKDEFRRRKTLYLVAPAACWACGIAIYAIWGAGCFWLAVAYFAIYHFVRQQYGFLMLYRRGEPKGIGYRIDQVAIYMATIYPLVYWHTYSRNFQWFDGVGVIRIPWVWPDLVFRAVYILALSAFLMKEAYRWRTTGALNAGKCLLLLATAAAWATGIILFNGDLTFSLINIISHGIPYMALIWIYQYRKRGNAANAGNRFLKFFQLKYIPLYALAVFAFAWFEEGVWDWMKWHEHANVFGALSIPASATALVILVPLLTMPQLTHYVLDAFIWRVNRKGKEEIRAVIG